METPKSLCINQETALEGLILSVSTNNFNPLTIQGAHARDRRYPVNQLLVGHVLDILPMASQASQEIQLVNPGVIKFIAELPIICY